MFGFFLFKPYAYPLLLIQLFLNLLGRLNLLYLYYYETEERILHWSRVNDWSINWSLFR